MHKNLRPMNLSIYYGGLEGTSTFIFIRDFYFWSATFFSSETFFSSAIVFIIRDLFFIRDFFFILDFFFHPRLFFSSTTFFFHQRFFFYPRLFFSIRDFFFCHVCGSLTLEQDWDREQAIAIAGEDRRFHGRRRHLGCGANAAKFTMNLWKKSSFWSSITSGRLTFYNFYELKKSKY